MCASQIDLRGNDLKSEGAKALAPAIRDSHSLTSVGLLGNKFDDETATMLLKIKEEKPALLTLCGLKPDQTEAHFVNWGLGPADAKLLAPEIARGSLTAADLRYTNLDDQAKRVLRDCVKDRAGFDLKL